MYGKITLKIPLSEADGSEPSDVTLDDINNFANAIAKYGYRTIDPRYSSNQFFAPFVSEVEVELHRDRN